MKKISLAVCLAILALAPDARASHNTCSLIAQAGGPMMGAILGEWVVEEAALVLLNSRLPQTFSGKVTVGRVPVTGDPIKVQVDATLLKPAKNVDIVCASSSFSSKFNVKARVSGKLGSDTHEGEGRVTGHYTVDSTSRKACVGNLKLAGLNLRGVQNDVDNWIRKKINASGLVANFCVP